MDYREHVVTEDEQELNNCAKDIISCQKRTRKEDQDGLLELRRVSESDQFLGICVGF